MKREAHDTNQLPHDAPKKPILALGPATSKALVHIQVLGYGGTIIGLTPHQKF